MSGPRYSQAGMQALKHGQQVTLTPGGVRGMVPREGEAAFRSGDRIVPARQARNLLAAVDSLPRRWLIRRTAATKGVWIIDMIGMPARPAGWQVTAPTCRDGGLGGHIFACACDWFPTYAEAAGYVGDVIDERRRDQLAAITSSEGAGQ